MLEFVKKTAFFAALTLSFFSCAINLSLDVSKGESDCVVTSKAKCFENFEKVAKSAAGTGEGQALFDGDSVEKALLEAKKTGVSVRAEESPSSLQARFSSDSVKNILPIQVPFVSFDDSKKRVLVNFNAEIAAQCLALLPENLRSMSELLMAPIFTGEKIDEAEYRENIALVYGNSLALDLDSSSVNFQILTAGKVENAYCSKKNFAKVAKEKNSANFEIPLTKILCAQGDVQFAVEFE